MLLFCKKRMLKSASFDADPNIYYRTAFYISVITDEYFFAAPGKGTFAVGLFEFFVCHGRDGRDVETGQEILSEFGNRCGRRGPVMGADTLTFITTEDIRRLADNPDFLTAEVSFFLSQV